MRSTRVHTDAAAPLLLLRGLGVDFAGPHGPVCVASGIDLEVAAGECLGVVGESGAGKSQVFLAVMGLLEANARTHGSARFGGQELLTLTPAQLDRVRGAGIAMVFQDPLTSLTPHVCIGDQIAEVRVRHLSESWRTARASAAALLERVHIDDPARRLREFPHQLSGGMRQRVMIAIALAGQPRLLIADEPTTALDVTIQAQILALLLELKRTQALALVLITHDLGAVAGLADRIAVLRHGRLIETGTVSKILAHPGDPYTQGLLQQAQRAAAPAPATVAAAGPTALEVNHVSVEFRLAHGLFAPHTHLRALQDVSFALAAGQSLALVGESGAGKSTLARAVLQLLPASGRVVWLGRELAQLSAAALRAQRQALQLIFQDPLASLDPRLKVLEIVSEGLRVHAPQLSHGERDRAAGAALERVGLPQELLERYPHELSGGQCQRVGIARAMILKPQLLVCDEPLSSLDVPTQQQIVALLGNLKRESGLCLLFVSHNLALVQQLCERVLVLYLGRMMELAPGAALEGAARHPYTRELLNAVPLPDPAVQPGRLGRARSGEPPSALAPPSGCVYRTRCTHAVSVCAERVPAWEQVGAGHHVACHRWREL